MNDTHFLHDGNAQGRATVLLAHGAGAPMDTDFMHMMASGLAEHGLHVARFEFAYMAARRSGGPKRPPPKADTLTDEFHAALDAVAATGPLFIAGKSMGGRIATMIADDLHAQNRIAGVIVLGYPFHPPGKPENLRTAHLQSLKTPTLICQGTRDPFGTRDEVTGYDLSDKITLHWLPDGNHDLKPRKRETGLTHADNCGNACDAIAAWTNGL